VYCVVAIARPKIGRHVERADEDERGKHVLSSVERTSPLTMG
jgi:hypothetical protein